MKFTLPKGLPSFGAHKKERTVSLATAQWTWFLFLISGALVFAIGGIHSMYSFMNIDVVAAVPLEEESQTTLRADRMRTVLTNYRERQEYFESKRALFESTTASAPRVEPQVEVPSESAQNEESAEDVATSTPPRLE